MHRVERLYTRTFFLSLAYNFLIALSVTNNAVLPLYVKEMGGTAQTVGLFMGVAAGAAVVARPVIGAMLDRVGVKPVLFAGNLMLSLAPIGYWLLLDYELFPGAYLLRAVHGFGFGAHFSAFFTLAAASGPSGRRNESIAMYGISGIAAHLVGPYLGETIFDSFGMPGFFFTMCGFGLIGLALLPFIHPGARARGNQRATPSLAAASKLIVSRTMRVPFTLALLLSVCFSSAQFFLAPLARERGIDDFGLYFTAYAVAGITVRLISRKWGDRFGVRRVMVPAFLLYMMGMGTILLSDTTALLMLAGAFSGSAHGLVFPAVNSLGYSLAPHEKAGSAVALITGMMDLGSIVTAFLFGAIAEATEYGFVFALAAAAGLGASLVSLASILRRPETIRESRDGS